MFFFDLPSVYDYANAITASDEMSDDLRAHMHAIKENEYNQLEELTSFLSLETNFVQSYLAVLRDVKEGWQGGYATCLTDECLLTYNEIFWLLYIG